MTYAEKLQNPKWQKKRLEIFERDRFACKYCSSTDHTLHVHHKYYQKGKEVWDYPDDCFQTVCKYCHQIIEFFKDKFQVVHEIKRLHMGSHCYAASLYCKGEKIIEPTTLMLAIMEFDREGEMHYQFVIWESLLSDLANLLLHPKSK